MEDIIPYFPLFLNTEKEYAKMALIVFDTWVLVASSKIRFHHVGLPIHTTKRYRHTAHRTDKVFDFEQSSPPRPAMPPARIDPDPDSLPTLFHGLVHDENVSAAESPLMASGTWKCVLFIVAGNTFSFTTYQIRQAHFHSPIPDHRPLNLPSSHSHP